MIQALLEADSAGAPAALSVTLTRQAGDVCIIGRPATATPFVATYVDSRGGLSAVALPTSEAVQDLLAASLGMRALTACLGILQTVQAIAPAADAVSIATEDGGMTLEFTDASKRREVMFAVPDDGSVRYFVASGEGVSRKTGIVVEDAGVSNLADWLRGREDFSSRGLQLGQRSASRP